MRQIKISRQITNRDVPSLDKYLHEIGKMKLITAENEIELAKRIKKGDRKALEMLVKANLRFVVSVAKQYQNQGLALADLINEGNLGLIKAARRFDETRGFKFISYAVWWIRQSIIQALAIHSRIVRLPLNRIGYMNNINKTYFKLEQEFQREPTSVEIAELTDSEPEMVDGALNYSNNHVSLDAPTRESEANNMYDLLLNNASPSPDTELRNQSLSFEIERSLATLKMRESEILRYYYGLNGYAPHSLEEIGNRLGLTRERVRQIKEKAIKKLGYCFRSRLLKDYLGE